MTFLGKQLTVTVDTERFLVVRREFLAGQILCALSARETFLVPRSFLESHSSFTDHLVALFASMAEVLCETGFAVDGSIARNETLVHYQLVTGAAFETGLVPFLAFEFVLFHPGAKYLFAGVASGGELVVVTFGAEEPVVDGGELSTAQRTTTFDAEEALLMPVLVLVGQILIPGPDDRLALGTDVGEQRLVALDAVRLLVAG